MAVFPFTDLHAFKDYVTYVQTYLPDRFPRREGLGPEDQWTMSLAFEGLYRGLDLAIEEMGQRPLFDECRALVEEAREFYTTGHVRDGFAKLEDVRRLLKRVPTQ